MVPGKERRRSRIQEILRGGATPPGAARAAESSHDFRDETLGSYCVAAEASAELSVEIVEQLAHRVVLALRVVWNRSADHPLEQVHGMRHGTARKILAEALWRYAEISGIWRGRRAKDGIEIYLKTT